MSSPELAGRTLSSSPHGRADYVDDLGRTYDALGTPAASEYWNQSPFLASIRSHLLKSNDYTVIDLTSFTPKQIGVVRQYVDGLTAAEQARIIRIGF